VVIQAHQLPEIIWIVWLVSWVVASFWSDREQARAETLETWIYRAPIIAGGALLVPWTGQLLGEKAIWEVSYPGLYVLMAAMVAGLCLTWWARIYLGRLWSSVITHKRNHKIIDTGPYAFVRHPIYCGLIIALLATALAEGKLVALLGSALVILGVWLKARTEERFLVAELGPEIYDAYRRRVPMLIPFLPPRR
jgi:protein-S-isoprenylcysteine O-methyltransferase Ste14